MEKRITKEVHIGNRVIGGANPILIQSMTNTKTEDVKATVDQIQRLTNAGCEIIRCAVPTMEAHFVPPMSKPASLICDILLVFGIFKAIKLSVMLICCICRASPVSSISYNLENVFIVI